LAFNWDSTIYQKLPDNNLTCHMPQVTRHFVYFRAASASADSAKYHRITYLTQLQFEGLPKIRLFESMLGSVAQTTNL